jgi:hypothetical protein
MPTSVICDVLPVLEHVSAILIDLDGVLYVEEQPVAVRGARDAEGNWHRSSRATPGVMCFFSSV